jgi:membrane protease YdiL (CAAX protease family)
VSRRRQEGGAATRRTDRTLVGLVIGLAMYNVVRSSVIDGDLDTATNLAVGAIVLLAGWWAGLSTRELGLDRANARAGLRLGLVAAAVVAAVVIIGAVVFSTFGTIDDSCVEISFQAMMLRVLVIIPIATAVVEETIFRGVLYGLLRRRCTVVAAAAIDAVLFGLWHVYPAWLDTSGTAVGVGRGATVAGTFVATTTAGLVLTWLRQRSGHLLAPILAHAASNSVTFAVAWFAVH